MEITGVTLEPFAYAVENAAGATLPVTYAPGETFEGTGLLLTIETDASVTGRYVGTGDVEPLLPQLERLARAHLLGRDPLERQGIWWDGWRALSQSDRRAMGPVDIALWDVAGRHAGLSVADLLGGYRDEIRAYATLASPTATELTTVSAFVDFVGDVVDRGYTAVKLHPNPHAGVDWDVEHVAAVATAYPEVDLLYDAVNRYDTYADALRVGRALDAHGVRWYEDPLYDNGESTYAGRKLEAALDLPILGPERSRTGPFGRANHLLAESAGVLRVDAALDGGITGVMKVAALAEAFGVDVELHLGGYAHLHCLAAIHNTSYYEHGFVHPEQAMTADVGLTTPIELRDDGTVALPRDAVGLGLEVDRGFVEKHRLERIVVD